MNCPYCENPVELVTGKVVYPTYLKLAEKKFWLCKPCNAYVGCHPGTERPLGTLADAKLRQARVRAHTAIDPLWQGGIWTRSQVYRWMATSLRIEQSGAHIALLTSEQCEEIVSLVNSKHRPKGRKYP